MSERLTTRDATVLKFGLALILEGRLGYSREQINMIGPTITTPYARAGDVIEQLGRLEIDGKAVFEVHRKTKRGKPYYQFECLMKEEELPGGSRGLAQALTLRMYMLLGTPVPTDVQAEDETDPPTTAAVNKLARELSLRPHKARVH